MGQSIEDLTPLISSMVPRRTANKRTVSEALAEMRWIRDIHGVASPVIISEFLKLWDLISEVILQQETPDKHIWRLTTAGQYTAKSAYEALFQGSVQFGPWERIWKTWAPGKCRFFM
ncbi:hypothetical protein PR202_ga19489 [Eleusine coracana subsp. coracana]|uniref:Uncharacterized protein n=1 Tax=Eleusine coracana subsp. coracana TaxID=191504 RepID=A0AAV5CVA4_ELECO|nr:hypothetical protein PR202_ga19489 [Eleusine coracana subsp. coracana]